MYKTNMLTYAIYILPKYTYVHKYMHLWCSMTFHHQPPKDLLIEVRVLQSCGTIMTDSGPVSLNKGSTNFLRRFDIEYTSRSDHRISK